MSKRKCMKRYIYKKSMLVKFAKSAKRNRVLLLGSGYKILDESLKYLMNSNQII